MYVSHDGERHFDCKKKRRKISWSRYLIHYALLLDKVVVDVSDVIETLLVVAMVVALVVALFVTLVVALVVELVFTLAVALLSVFVC